MALNTRRYEDSAKCVRNVPACFALDAVIFSSALLVAAILYGTAKEVANHSYTLRHERSHSDGPGLSFSFV